MKIEGYKLKNFVKKASLNGSMMAISMEFKEDGLHSKMIDPGKVAMTEVFLKRDSFEDYEEKGEIFIKDVILFIRYLATFGSYVDISFKKDYVMVLKDDNRVGEVMLGAEVVCDGAYKKDLPELELDEKIVVSKNDLDRSIRDISLLKTDKLKIIREKNGLVFEIGEKDNSDCFRNIIDLEEEGSEQQVVIGSNFLKLFECLDGDISLELKTDFPIRVIEENDTMKYVCIIAPIVENN